MNIALFYIRCYIALCFIAIAGGFYIREHDIPTGTASLLVAALVLIPVIRLRFNPGKLGPSTPFKDYLNMKSIMAACRWNTGLMICLVVTGGVMQREYNIAVPFFSLAVIFMSPLDDVVFAWWQPLTVATVVARNMGLFFYLIAIGIYMDDKYPAAAVCCMAVALFLLFFGPASVYYKSRKAGLPFTLPVDPPPVARNKQPVKRPVWEMPRQPAPPPSPPAPATVVLPPPVNTPATATGNDLQALKEEFEQLIQLAPQHRGYAFQDFLNKLFHDYHLDPKKAFRLTGEEIDGSFELDGHVYLVEAKWQEKPTGQADLLVFNGKVEGKSAWARGLFISYNGFSKEGLQAFARGKGTRIIGMDGSDIACILNGQISLPRAINKKARRAVETNEFFVPLSELI